jgi:pimeloyl-ACP methyl ester carboxylesterase
MPLLAKKYHVIAPDLPGFGFTATAKNTKYTYTFDNLANTVEAFLVALGVQRYTLYIFDYGAPVGLRLAIRNPSAITAIITQNGNAFMEGFGAEFWAPLRNYWKSGLPGDREALRAAFSLEAIRSQVSIEVSRTHSIGVCLMSLPLVYYWRS